MSTATSLDFDRCRIAIRMEGGQHVAHLLDYDLVAQGPTRAEALLALASLLAHIDASGRRPPGRAPLDDFHRAGVSP